MEVGSGPVRRRVAVWLLVAAGALAAWAALGANGAGLSDGLWGLRAGVIGVYLTADADKTVRDGFVAAGAPDGITLAQRDACVTELFARSCNLPWLELRLGLSLALAALVATAGAWAWSSSPTARLAGVLLGVGLAAALAGVGLSNGLIQDAPLPASLGRAVLGAYLDDDGLSLATPAPVVRSADDPGAPASRPFWAFYTATQHDGCTGRDGAPDCLTVLVLLPLRTWLLASGALILAGAGVTAAAVATRGAGPGYARSP